MLHQDVKWTIEIDLQHETNFVFSIQVLLVHLYVHMYVHTYIFIKSKMKILLEWFLKYVHKCSDNVKFNTFLKTKCKSICIEKTEFTGI